MSDSKSQSLPAVPAGSNAVSNPGAHAAAAKHHEMAAQQHQQAVKCQADGKMEQAGQCSKKALQHGEQAHHQAAKADRQWDAATDPAKQRGVHARQLGADTARGTATAKAAIGMKPVPRAAITAVNETLSEAGAPGEAAEGEA